MGLSVMETKHARITPQHAAGGHVSRKHHELQQAFLALLWWQVVVVVVLVGVVGLDCSWGFGDGGCGGGRDFVGAAPVYSAFV